jgi:hypothetical protein
MKKPISVTLSPQNLLWLRGRALAAGSRSVSEFLDDLVTSARSRGRRMAAEAPRSVVGTVRISSLDPGLDTADSAVRALAGDALRRSAHALVSPRRTSGAGRRRRERARAARG